MKEHPLKTLSRKTEKYTHYFGFREKVMRFAMRYLTVRRKAIKAFKGMFGRV